MTATPSTKRGHGRGWLLGLCLGVALCPLAPQVSRAQAADPDSLGYGNTPEALRPFARFAEPYKQFFVDSLIYTGPGRDKPEPDVATVRIGVLAPLEGSNDAYIGQPMLKAIELAVDEANAEGGYRGKPFELMVHNDTGLWGASANEIVKLSYEDSVWAVLGTVDGANTHIAIRVALKTELPIVNVADTDPTLVETKIPWVFRTIADDRQMAYVLAWHIYQESGFERVAIVRADNRYGRFGVSEFRSASTRLRRPAPIEVNYEIAWRNVNPEFTVQLQRLQRVQPDAIILWADAHAAAALLRAIRGAGIEAPIFACDRLLEPGFLEEAGAAAEGVVIASPWNPTADNPRYAVFREAYRARHGEDPDTYASHAYDGARMLVDAIRQAGLNRYRIRDALAAVHRYEGVTGTIVMDKVHSDRGAVSLATVRSGAFVFGEPTLRARF